MIVDPRRIAPLDPACRMTVVIPARNEAEELPATLAAFARQRDLAGAAQRADAFELIVFCNGCSDHTYGVVRAFAAAHPTLAVHVLVADAAEVAHVGEARGAALDLAARRFLAAGRRLGVLASSDADTVVDDAWVAWTLRELEGADAVGGYVRVSDAVRDRMLAPQRLLYDRELAYRRLLGSIQERFDPRPYDPWPRHDSLVGASFAVTVEAYVRAGGLPRLAYHEDVAFAGALDRSDARVRHSYDVKATTSGRSTTRVERGFGDFLAALARKGAKRESHFVPAAAATIELARARRLLRVWDAERARSVRPVAKLLGISAATLSEIAADAATEGERWHRLVPLARQSAYPEQPAERVIATFRRVLAETARDAGDAAASEAG